MNECVLRSVRQQAVTRHAPHEAVVVVPPHAVDEKMCQKALGRRSALRRGSVPQFFRHQVLLAMLLKKDKKDTARCRGFIFRYAQAGRDFKLKLSTSRPITGRLAAARVMRAPSSLLLFVKSLALALATRHEEAEVLDHLVSVHPDVRGRHLSGLADSSAERGGAPSTGESSNDKVLYRSSGAGRPEEGDGVGVVGGESLRDGGQSARRAMVLQEEAFVSSAHHARCDIMWSGWAESQEAALEAGTVLVFDVYTSVGNLFITLGRIMPIVRRLEIGLILTFKSFEGFRLAFDPAEINWDADYVPYRRRLNEIIEGEGPPGRHGFDFLEGFVILSDLQVERVADELGLNTDATATEMALMIRQILPRTVRGFVNLVATGDARPVRKDGVMTSPDACAWNMLLKRSPSMMAAMNAHRPWEHGSAVAPFAHAPRYAAWHIRTSDGESSYSFHPSRHRYIFHGQKSSDVFPAFLLASEKAKDTCRSSFAYGGVDETSESFLFISSNSKSMARNCSADARSRGMHGGFVDLGLSAEDSHTRFSTNPNTAVNAFIDFLFLMDAEFIVRTSSSFSGTVALIRGLDCRIFGRTSVLDNGISVCMPSACPRGSKLRKEGFVEEAADRATLSA